MSPAPTSSADSSSSQSTIACPDLSKRLAAWADRLLGRDPARRPESAAAAHEALEDVAESVLAPRWRREAPLYAVAAVSYIGLVLIDGFESRRGGTMRRAGPSG